jgi:hypothetical protein
MKEEIFWVCMGSKQGPKSSTQCWTTSTIDDEGVHACQRVRVLVRVRALKEAASARSA